MASTRGVARVRLLPILITCFGLFTAAGWAAPGGIPEANAFAATAEASAAGGEGALTGSDGGASHPVATDAQAESVASAEAAQGPVATLQFARGSTAVARKDHAILRAVAALYARTGGTIEVVGHADRGSARGAAARQVNWRTAERRAAGVAERLVSLGLPSVAISAESRGDTQPRYAETTAAGAAGNRRVEVYLRPAPAPETSAQPQPNGALISEVPAGTASGDVPPEARSVASSHSDAEVAASVAIAAASGAAAPVQTTAEISRGSGRVQVATLYFPHGSSRLGRRERAIVEAAAFFHRQHRGTFVIIGHASAGGGSTRRAESLDRANRSVSRARADAVARALAAEGVAAAHMSMGGRGADEPAFAEDTAAGVAGNRRVEIYVDLPAAVRLADRGQGLLR